MNHLHSIKKDLLFTVIVVSSESGQLTVVGLAVVGDVVDVDEVLLVAVPVVAVTEDDVVKAELDELDEVLLIVVVFGVPTEDDVVEAELDELDEVLLVAVVVTDDDETAVEELVDDINLAPRTPPLVTAAPRVDFLNNQSESSLPDQTLPLLLTGSMRHR